jgi:hypothetical protein
MPMSQEDGMSEKASKDKRKAETRNEANVLLELRMNEAMSEEVLDANSDDVLDAVAKHAAKIALGPTVSLNLKDCAIRLRFDVVAANNARLYEQIAKVVGVIETRTDISFLSSNVETHDDEDARDTEFVRC